MNELTTEDAIAWFEKRKAGVTMPGASAMYDKAIAALRAQTEAECNKPLTLDEPMGGNNMKFLVHKHSGDVEVLLLPFKGTNQYSFVNLTRGHICPCMFNSVDEALQDMEDRKSRGLLDGYEIVKEDAPLTLDELRKMDGKMVRIARIGERIPYDSAAAFVHTKNELCRTADGCNAFFELYGVSWLAYRHKPMEGTT